MVSLILLSRFTFVRSRPKSAAAECPFCRALFGDHLLVDWSICSIGIRLSLRDCARVQARRNMFIRLLSAFTGAPQWKSRQSMKKEPPSLCNERKRTRNTQIKTQLTIRQKTEGFVCVVNNADPEIPYDFQKPEKVFLLWLIVQPFEKYGKERQLCGSTYDLKC